jgi:hypothetical protein
MSVYEAASIFHTRDVILFPAIEIIVERDDLIVLVRGQHLVFQSFLEISGEVCVLFPKADPSICAQY